MIDITDILCALLALLATLTSSLLLPLLRRRLGIAKAEQLEKAAEIAVLAAEQLLGGGRGKEKLQYAKNYLESHGFTADEGMIEAKVKTLFGKEAA